MSSRFYRKFSKESLSLCENLASVIVGSQARAKLKSGDELCDRLINSIVLPRLFGLLASALVVEVAALP